MDTSFSDEFICEMLNQCNDPKQSAITMAHFKEREQQQQQPHLPDTLEVAMRCITEKGTKKRTKKGTKKGTKKKPR